MSLDEIVKIVVELVGILGGFAYFLGKQTTKIKNLETKMSDQAKTYETQISGLEDSIADMSKDVKKIMVIEQQLEFHKERIGSVSRDHQHLEDSLEKVASHLGETSLKLATLTATIEGFQGAFEKAIDNKFKTKR